MSANATTVSKAAATKAAPKAAAAPTTVISKYRGLMHLAAVELGFIHTQPATMVDQYTKGDTTITLAWSATKLQAYQVTAKGQPQGIVQGKGSMLQRAQSAMGKAIPLSGPGSKWNLSTKGKAEMDAYATSVFKVVEVKA